MPRFATTAALLACIATTAAALAQQQVPVPPAHYAAQSSNSASQDPNRPQMPIIDVEFPGGEVLAFVQAVQKAAMASEAKTPVNVMVPAEAGMITLPAISLKRVSAETALETLRYAFGMQGQHQFETRNMTNNGDQGLTFAIQYSPGRSAAMATNQNMMMPPIQSEAYSLRELISAPMDLPQSDAALRMSDDAVLGALKLAAELEAGDSRVAPSQLLFHPDSQLLIARGTPDQHRLINSVLSQLSDTIQQRRHLYSDAAVRKRAAELQRLDLEAQVQAARAQFDRALTELRPAEAELQRIEQLVAAGSAGSGELERARANLEIARANASAAEANAVLAARRRELIEEGFAESTAGASPREQIMVIYDLRDLASYKRDFFDLVKTVIAPDGKMDVKPISGDTSGSIAVRASRAQHEILVAVFNTSRRLKTNEPKLPGITLDQLIQQSKE